MGEWVRSGGGGDVRHLAGRDPGEANEGARLGVALIELRLVLLRVLAGERGDDLVIALVLVLGLGEFELKHLRKGHVLDLLLLDGWIRIPADRARRARA